MAGSQSAVFRESGLAIIKSCTWFVYDMLNVQCECLCVSSRMFACCLDHVCCDRVCSRFYSHAVSAEDGGLARCFLDNRVHADIVVGFTSLGVDHLSAFANMFTRLRLARASRRRSRGR